MEAIRMPEVAREWSTVAVERVKRGSPRDCCAWVRRSYSMRLVGILDLVDDEPLPPLAQEVGGNRGNRALPFALDTATPPAALLR